MCLMVWLGSARPLAAVLAPTTPDPIVGYFNVTAEPVDSPVRAQFLQPYVSYVGSHEGCGCGFCSQQMELAGYDLVADVMLAASEGTVDAPGCDGLQIDLAAMWSKIDRLA
jgi:hypothetical protein